MTAQKSFNVANDNDALNFVFKQHHFGEVDLRNAIQFLEVEDGIIARLDNITFKYHDSNANCYIVSPQAFGKSILDAATNLEEFLRRHKNIEVTEWPVSEPSCLRPLR